MPKLLEYAPAILCLCGSVMALAISFWAIIDGYTEWIAYRTQTKKFLQWKNGSLKS